jgi:thymidine phosphorylase
MDTTALGWAVQRTGAGREKAGEPVDPHAGIDFHARRGARIEKGQPSPPFTPPAPNCLAEPIALLKEAISLSKTPPPAVPLGQPHLYPRNSGRVSARCCKVVSS